MNIVIIEDSFEDFKKIRKILGAEHHCYPDVGVDRNQFVSHLQIFRNCISPNLTNEEKEQAKDQALSLIQSFGDIDAFIIDYALVSENYEEQTGLDFHRFLYANGINKPSLLLTHVDGEGETNKILEHFHKANSRFINDLLFDYRRKNFGDTGFESLIQNFVSRNNTTFDNDFFTLRQRIIQAKLQNQNVVNLFDKLVSDIEDNSALKNANTYAEVKKMLEREINDTAVKEFCSKVTI